MLRGIRDLEAGGYQKRIYEGTHHLEKKYIEGQHPKSC